MDDLSARGDPEFMTSLARGLTVLRCFADRAEPMTIAQAARMTGLSRPAVKRCLHTLVRLDYAAQDGSKYALTPKVLALGHAFLSSNSLALRAQPLLDKLRDELHESCSLGVLQDDQVYYVARAEISRIMSVALRVGSRLPAYCTSMGRILMAGRLRSGQEAYLSRTELAPLTARTEINRSALLERFSKAAADGYAIVDQELEIGLRSVAVPVMAGTDVVAAVNIGTQAGRVTMAELRTRYLPALRRTAQAISAMT